MSQPASQAARLAGKAPRPGTTGLGASIGRGAAASPAD